MHIDTFQHGLNGRTRVPPSAPARRLGRRISRPFGATDARYPRGSDRRFDGSWPGAPALRLEASDIGAAWGRGGGGRIAACAPDEDTLTLAWDAADRGARRGRGSSRDAVDAIFWGTSRPPFAEGPSLAFLAVGARASPTDGRRRAARGIARTRAWKRWPRAPTRSRPDRPASRWSSRPTRCGPGSAPDSKRAAARARPRSCSAPTGGTAALGRQRVTHSRPFLDRYRGDGEIDNRDLYDARLFREEIFLPRRREVARAARRVRRARRGRSPTPTAGSARWSPSASAPTPAASAAVYAAVGDTGAAAALLGAVGAIDTRRDSSRSSAPAAGARPACSSTSKQPVPGAAHVADRARRRPARVATPRCCARAGNSYPAARRSRWACRPRARCSCAAPTRCSACSAGAASTAARSARRRRSTRLHQLRRTRSSSRSRSPRRRGAHVRRQPDDAGAVRRAAADRGARHGRRRAAHAAGRSATAPTSRSAAGSSSCCASTRTSAAFPCTASRRRPANERRS